VVLQLAAGVATGALFCGIRDKVHRPEQPAVAVAESLDGVGGERRMSRSSWNFVTAVPV
jgi:hypothetical protein